MNKIVKKAKYIFDNFMAKGNIALIISLGVIAVILSSVIAIVMWILGGHTEESFVKQILVFIHRAVRFSPHLDKNIPSQIGLILIGLVGLFFSGMFIGLIVKSFQDKMRKLRDGKSEVLENDHVLILGWAPQIFNVIRELLIAYENQQKTRIVILGTEQKSKMEDQIVAKIFRKGKKYKNTKIICRNGNPMDTNDLNLTGINRAKSIILLYPESDNSDSNIIKSLLAITNNPNRKKDSYHIVTSFMNKRNEDIINIVGKKEVEAIHTGNLISRLTAQACRQSGLSVIYSELLSFEGDEIHFTHEPQLSGKKFEDAIMAFNTSAVIGIFRKRENKVLVHPQMDLVIEPADDIIVITEDEMTGTISGITEYNMNKEAIIKVKSDDTTPEHILILGWNKKAPFIINELNNYVPPGSEVEVLTDYEAGEAEIEKHCKNNKNLKCNFISGDTSDRKILDKLNFKLYKHVILLSYSDTLNEEEADAKTLITLLHLRDIMEKLNVNFSIVSEMLNIDNQRLARITRADDFIVSENIISMILTQLLENKNLSEVFRILFSAEGSEFYLKPADKYLKLNKKMNFYTVIQAVKQSNEIALGYRKIKHKDDRDKHFGVVLNPVKTKEITFEEGDKIIVLAD